MTKPLKQVHLAAHFPGVNNTTVWSDPRSGSHIAYESPFRRAISAGTTGVIVRRRRTRGARR